jgi:hypothetical protein
VLSEKGGRLILRRDATPRAQTRRLVPRFSLIFISSLFEAPQSRIDRLRGPGATPHRENGAVAAMFDVVYLGIGFLFFALMGLYAIACDRLQGGSK